MAAGLLGLAVARRPIKRRELEGLATAARDQVRRQLEAEKPEDAEASCRRALDALDKLLASQPNDRDYRRGRAEMLELLAMALVDQHRPDEAALAYRQAVPLWADLVAERPGEIGDRSQMADCLDRYGLLLVDIGRWDEADYVFSRGRSLCEKVPEPLKSEARVRRDLVVFLCRLARLTLDMGRRTDALEDFAQAVAVQRDLTASPTGTRENQERLIAILIDQSEAESGGNRAGDAEKSLGEARDLAERLAAASSGESRPRDQALLATVLYRLASLIQTDSKRLAEARVLFERAATIQEELAARPGDRRNILAGLAATCGGLADLLCTQGLYPDAEPFYRKELACQTKLVQANPEDASARFAHGRVLHNLADFLRERGRTRDALTLEREAVKELIDVYNKDFRNPEYRRALSYACWTLCALDLDFGDHRAAARAVEQYRNIEPSGFDEPLESARFLCRCIALCRADRSLREPEREKLARDYADAALSSLETAVHNGYADRGDLERAGCYEPLRDRDDFARLIQEVAARSRLAGKD
jgi:tetratricopeptide (TPR) repeat protein